jgi:hypothetical protein
MTEWLKLMLEEIARRQAERERGLAEAARRAQELGAARCEKSAAQARGVKSGRTSDP